MKKCISMLLVLAMILSLMPVASFAAGAEVKEGIVTETVGDIRVQFLSPSVVRIEAKGPKGFEDRNTFHIVNRTEWDGDTVTVEEGEAEVVFTTTTSKVVIPTDSDITKCKIYDLNGVLIWEYRQLDSNKQDLPEFNEQVWAWQITDTPRVVPSEQGFAYVEGVTELSDTNGWDLDNDAEDVYIFLPENDHRQLRKDFVNLTGRTEMLDLSALGIWDSRWWVYSQETALAQIDGYHDLELPLDVLVVDTDWRTATNGRGYDINTELFPDMEQFFEDAHARNVSVMFNDHPEPTKDDEGNQNNVLKAEEVEYRQSNLTRLLEMGLDGWWYDRNWSTTVKPLAEFTHEVMGMATYNDAYKTVYPESRLFQMANMDGNKNGQTGGASNIAAHRYGIHWTGDTGGYQELLLHEMETAIEYGEVSAIPYVSTDIGGFYTKSNSISDAEYVRWIQYSAFSPIFRLHCTKGAVGRMPWMWSDEAVDLTRDYMNLRYRLLPVFYQLSHENYETGMPLVRHMTAEYPEYAGADRADQFMLGEDILVAPATTASRELYFTNEYLTTPDGAAGVKAEYYNTVDLTGDVVLTNTASTINFSWGSNAPNSSVGTNNFSIRFSGNFTIPGETDSMVTLSMDEGARLYVDGELVIDNWDKSLGTYVFTDKVYEAGSTHSFVLEYFDSTGSASVVLGCASGNEELSAERTVWIPEGQWINAFTGEEICGPTTITISCGLDDMPVFIKAGSVIPLADETLTTADSDWSHLTLDYYPSASQEDTTEIYEDDTASVAYQNGEYRTTEVSTGFADGKATLTIAAAQGSFEGELAFETRDWTVRVHQPKGWGELTAVTDAAGNSLEFVKIDADASAMALDNDGAAPDATVYEIKLTSDIYEEQKLSFTFETPTENTAKGDETPAVAAAVPVKRSVTIEEFPSIVNLSKEGTIDWIHTGYTNGTSVVRKSNDFEYIRYSLGDEKYNRSNDCPTAFAWDDSADGTAVGNCHNFSFTYYRDNPYKISVTATQEEQVLTVYVGGFRSYSRLTISDGTKGGTSVYDFGNTAGSYYKKVQIRLSAEQDTELNISHEVYAVQVTNGNASFYGATLAKASDVLEPAEITASVEVTDTMPTTVDLTAEGTGDWLYGYRSNGQFIRKANVTPAVELSCLTITGNMSDYKTGYTQTDGTATMPSKTTRGIYSNYWIRLRAPVDENTETLKLYVGGWYSQGTMEISDDAGNILDTQVFENNAGSYYRVVTIDVSATANTYLNIYYYVTANYRTNGNGNVTFSAATFTGSAHEIADQTPVYSDANYLILSTGTYASGTWTAEPVTVALSARYPEKVAAYQVKEGETWTDLEGSTYTVSENGTSDLTFRYVDAEGNFSAEKTVQVNIDNVVPVLTVNRTEADEAVTFSAEVTAGQTGATVYYRVDGGNWTVMNGDVTASTRKINFYRFKAVGGNGLESSTVAQVTALVDADELEAAKAQALQDLANARNALNDEDYRQAQVAELEAVVTDAVAAIHAAEIIPEVTEALEAALAALDAVKTHYEMTMEEMASGVAAAEAAQKAAEAAQAAAEAAKAAADEAAASAAEDMAAAEAAQAAAELAQAQAEAAQAAAEAAKEAAEAENKEAAEAAAQAAESAASAATAASTAAQAASTAQAAQAAAEAAQAAAEEAAASTAEDRTAAEAAASAAQLAQTQASAAKAAAESAMTSAEAAAQAAEESNTEAAKEAAAAAESAKTAADSATAAAGSAQTAAEAAASAQEARDAAEAAEAAAEEAAQSAAEDKAGAETAKVAAELAKTQAEAALDAALKAQTASEEAAEAAEESNLEAAKQAAIAAASSKASAESAAAAATSALTAAEYAKAAQEAQAKAEAAQKEAEDAARKAKEEADRIAAESALNLSKTVAVIELNEYAQELQKTAGEENAEALAEAAKAAREALLAAESQEALDEAVSAARAGLEAIAQRLCAAEEFVDVDLDAWYHDAVDFVLNEGMMSGNGDGTFTPETALSRAMLVQILYNIEGRPEVETDKSFSDVSEADWYYSAVMWAAQNGIVLGNDDGTYAPEKAVTREQMVTILYRYAGSPEVDDAEITFADADAIDEWAAPAVSWAVANGVVKGKGENTFDPDGNSTRAETAQVMLNYFGK